MSVSKAGSAVKEAVGRHRYPVLFLLLALGAAARLWMASLLTWHYDQESYEIVAGILRDGGNVYAETMRYNYSPLWFLTVGGLDGLTGQVGIPFHIGIRLLLTAVDLLTALVVWRLSHRLLAVAVFMLNPVSVVITGYHGAFDNAAVLLVLVALWQEMRGRRSWLALIGSVIVKPSVVPALMYVPIRSLPRLSSRLWLTMGAVALLAASTLPWATSSEAILGIGRNVFLYAIGLGPANGANEVMPFLVRVALLLVLAIGAVYAPRLGPHRAALAWTLILVAMTPGTEQRYILPIAIAAMRPSWWLAAFTGVAFLALLGSPQEFEIAAFATFNGWPMTLISAAWLLALAVQGDPVRLGAWTAAARGALSRTGAGRLVRR